MQNDRDREHCCGMMLEFEPIHSKCNETRDLNDGSFFFLISNCLDCFVSCSAHRTLGSFARFCLQRCIIQAKVLKLLLCCVFSVVFFLYSDRMQFRFVFVHMKFNHTNTSTTYSKCIRIISPFALFLRCLCECYVYVFTLVTDDQTN